MPAHEQSVHPEDAISQEDLDKPFAPLDTSEPSARYYPLSLFLLALWSAVIIVTVVLLEEAVAAAPKTVDPLPWYYANDGLPAVFLTLFAQGHVGVTAFHLSRLAISGLHSKMTAPRTWREVFWSADGKWSAPLGIATSIKAAIAAKTGLSIAFFQFSFVALVAFATPLLLNRAYPFADVETDAATSFNPDTLSVDEVTNVDGFAQIATGAGAWSTGLTVNDLFNSSIYLPASVQREADPASGEVFFAGDGQGLDVTLPGVRITGGCSVEAAVSNMSNQSTFLDYCQGAIASIGENQTAALATHAFDLDVSYCTTASFNTLLDPSNVTSVIYFSNGNRTGVLEPGGADSALVRCNTLFEAGTAALDGTELTFSNFTANATIYQSSQANTSLQDPQYAALFHLTQVALWGTDEGEAMSTDMFGYKHVAGVRYLAPSEAAYAAAMWNGVTHMTASIAFLSQSSNVSYPATMHVTVAGRVVNDGYRIAAFTLLGVWFVGIVGLTAWMWRRTFDSALGHWQAAQLWSMRNGAKEYQYEEKSKSHPDRSIPPRRTLRGASEISGDDVDGLTA